MATKYGEQFNLLQEKVEEDASAFIAAFQSLEKSASQIDAAENPYKRFISRTELTLLQIGLSSPKLREVFGLTGENEHSKLISELVNKHLAGGTMEMLLQIFVKNSQDNGWKASFSGNKEQGFWINLEKPTSDQPISTLPE